MEIYVWRLGQSYALETLNYMLSLLIIIKVIQDGLYKRIRWLQRTCKNGPHMTYDVDRFYLIFIFF